VRALAIVVLTLSGCASALGPEYLGVEGGTARYGISFAGSSGKLSIAGTASVTQLGVRFTAEGWTEETDTASDLPLALARATPRAPGTANRAASGLAWRKMGDSDEVILFALRRVLRLVDLQLEEGASIEIRFVRRPTAADPSVACDVRLTDAHGVELAVALVLEPDRGLSSATVTTAGGVYRIRRLA
jgi:hypothetical protein